MKIVEMFDSIDGEGVRAGLPCSFVRLAGCNIRCSYCDTSYALFGEEKPCEYKEMTVDEIISGLNRRFMRVTLTGGEPLIHRDCRMLVKRMAAEGYEVNIETNGAVSLSDFFEGMPRMTGVFLTVDYKLVSSGVSDKMIWENFVNLRSCDIVKFVVGSDDDLVLMKKVIEKMLRLYGNNMPGLFAGVVYGAYEPVKLVNEILSEPLFAQVRYQTQLHKLVWDPEKRGV